MGKMYSGLAELVKEGGEVLRLVGERASISGAVAARVPRRNVIQCCSAAVMRCCSRKRSSERE